MKFIIKLLIKQYFTIFILSPFFLMGQSDNLNGVVTGNVLNISQDSSAVANLEVALNKYVDGQKVENFQKQTVTDVNGHFIFKGLEAGEKFAYYPVVVYSDIEYSGPVVQPVQSANVQQSDVSIYESTASDSSISVIMSHLIIEPGVDVLNIRELIFFSNSGDQTYIGDKPTTTGKKIVLNMKIPENAVELQMSGDIMSCCAVVNNNQIFDTMEFKPGTRKVILSYVLPYKRKDVSFTKTVEYTINSMDIFMPAPLRLSNINIKTGIGDDKIISGDQIEEPQPFDIRGEKYSRYNLGNIPKGSTYSLTITNLPKAYADYRWIAPIVLVLIIIIGVFIHRKFGSGALQGTDNKDESISSVNEDNR